VGHDPLTVAQKLGLGWVEREGGRRRAAELVRRDMRQAREREEEERRWDARF
jgi:hypothetical protein